MDAGAGHVEVGADVGLVAGRLVADDFAVVVGDVGDDAEVHAVGVAAEGGVFDGEGLDGGVAGAFADAEEGAVGRGAAVEPGGAGVDDDFVEVVVAVPFEPGRGGRRRIG